MQQRRREHRPDGPRAGPDVINQRPNVDRRDYDQLKAILHNSVRLGPESQNRDRHPRFRAHLRGRVAWVQHLNPARGERLLATFSQINWESTDTVH